MTLKDDSTVELNVNPSTSDKIMKNLLPPSMRLSEFEQITRDEIEIALEKMDYYKADVINDFFYKIGQNLVLPADEETLAHNYELNSNMIVRHDETVTNLVLANSNNKK
ncbi:MAG: hypothetical protein ACI8ZB_003142 [Desulforhopalus sp.]